MSFNPKLFLDVAEVIRKDGTDEKHMRSEINRHYYACFGVARAITKVQSSDIGVHKEVISSLKNNDSINLKKAGSDLDALFKFRKQSDYDFRRPLIPNTYVVAQKTCEQFFINIEAFENEEDEDE